MGRRWLMQSPRGDRLRRRLTAQASNQRGPAGARRSPEPSSAGSGQGRFASRMPAPRQEVPTPHPEELRGAALQGVGCCAHCAV